MKKNNPFEFKYPDDINPSDVLDLFVPVFGEYYNVPKSGHTFINGPRGSGKTMMFRYMKPDCQVFIDSNGERIQSPKEITELDYFALYIPIKKGQLKKTDIQLNNKHGLALLNEHMMIIHMSIFIFKELKDVNFPNTDENRNELMLFYNETFLKWLKFSGYHSEQEKIETPISVESVFSKIIMVLRGLNSEFQHKFLKKLIGSTEPVPYEGALLLYSDFLYEILLEFKKLSLMPNCPIYLLIDDADELSIIQQQILNSWVAMRTSHDISLKISTQLKYKVYKTINDSRIDTPHDYSEVNLNDIYTTKKNLYFKRISEIVSKRLIKNHFEITDPLDFFPQDQDQEKKIELLKEEYKKKMINEGASKEQAKDYAYRYVVPDYIKNLQGNRYTYSYAGFKQLVNISSGIIREFIDFSSEMFIAQLSESENNSIDCISPSIQNSVIRKYSENKMDREFVKLRVEAVDKDDMDKLKNLIEGMGGLFQLILKSETSERRVFSIALNDEPDEELRRILNLAVENGYLQKSMIGNKYGTGKVRLYILNRVLAPHFGLDPSNFAGYQFMDSSTLKIALSDSKKFTQAFSKKLSIKEDDSQIKLKYD